MGRPVEPAVFIREFLTNFLESQLVNGRISTGEYHDSLASLRKNSSLASVSQKLFNDSPDPIVLDGYKPFRLIYLREPNGREFPFLQGLADGDSPAHKKLTCFVGHRFLKNIEKSLRFNLVHLFEPYGIHLRWSGYDLSARGVFDDVISGIKSSDLCFFDNLGTLNKPNVYIEVGIAHVLGKPMLVCESLGHGSKGTGKVPDTGSVPSDLQGLIRLQYRNYQDLCRQLYFGLPIFLENYGFR
ncbi:MAG TPA: hypothetical protein VHC97_17420 [Thermoanaerobaculia bacterium]|nr:hypothetical protein [Thermoanaerobaculia bacterium]